MASMRTSLPLVLLPAVAVSIGCTALLGDFTSSPDGGDLSEGGPGGGESGASSSGSGSSGGSPMDGPTGPDGSDAGKDADALAPLQLLTCNSFDNATPTLLMKL